MLGEFDVVINVAVKDLEESKKFYGELLGLKAVGDYDFGTLYETGKNKGRLLVYPAPTAGTAKSTTATWDIKDIKAVINKLEAAGAKFEHYEYPGAKYDGPVHIWGGMKAAWFRDPSGNILGINEGDNRN